MRKPTYLVSLLALAVAVTPISAKPVHRTARHSTPEHRQIPGFGIFADGLGWVIYRSNGGNQCYAKVEFNNGGELTAGYNRAEALTLTIKKPGWNFEGQQQIETLLVVGGFGRIPATATVYHGESMDGLIYTDERTGSAFLAALEKSDGLIVTFNHTIEATIDFKVFQSRPMFEMLRSCGSF